MKKKSNFHFSFTMPSYFNYLDKRIILKCFLLLVISLICLSKTFSWMYHEYVGGGASIKLGSIKHEVMEYDINGNLINSNDETLSLIYETNMSNKTKNTRYIEIKNVGSLDLEYSLTFNVNGNAGETGILYYRLYDITDKVKKMSPSGVNDTKLKAYAAVNPIPDDIESNTSNPVSNLSTLNNKIEIGEIEKDEKNDENNSVYYRLDYGMYSSIDSSIYSDTVISAHLNVYTSQVGTITSELALGKVWDVQNEEQFRAALQGAYPGDTIRLLDDIIIDGTIEFNKRVSLDTNEQLFKVTGDFVYDFVNLGKLIIDTTGSGRIEIGNDFYINAPKAQVELVGANKASDIVVGGKMRVNGTQDGEKDGVLLDNVRIVKNTTSYIPIDITVLSNTRLTIAPDVEVGFIKANTGSTNIEIINNGVISQIQLQNMSLLDTFTKPQIYIYNLGDIYGVVGSTSIVLPAKASPYFGPTNGNTLIVKGVTSSDITISGSENFENDNVDDETEGTSVIPFEDEENAYYVYIREPSDNVKELLTQYFNLKQRSATDKIASIKKLAIYTLNAQYLENDDFDFFRSDETSNLSYLDLSNARVKDNNVVNRIKANALANKITLKTVILPKTLSEIGAGAFEGIELGHLSTDTTVDFNFLSIPSTVDVIEARALINAKYVRFEGSIPPTRIDPNAFDTSDDGSKIFVLDGVQDVYQSLASLNSSNIFRNANISDNRKYFVYNVGEDLGISYIINSNLSTTTLGVPDTLSYLSGNKKIVEIGTNAYRHINISDEDGVAASLPATITKINSYAFYGLNITNINLTNIEFIGKYAFYETKLESIEAPNVKIIEKYAFYNTTAKTLYLENIENIGDYAFAYSPNLYEANLASVKYLGKYAFYDCKQMGRVYFENTNSKIVNNKEEIDLYVGENATFSNWGYYINDRLRIYVPTGTSENNNTYVQLYKDKFNQFEKYIYETGETIGSYKHMEVPFDLTEYTVSEKVITTPSGEVAVGYEIISYQGSDLETGYNIPDELTVGDKTMPVISVGNNAYRNTKVKENNELTIFSDNIVNIGSYAFMDLKIKSITASNVETIGSYAFSGSTLHKGIFRSLLKLGDYALANINELYVLDLGTIKEFGYNSIANDRYLEQLFISNKTMDITLNGTPFSNIGTFTKDRLRIYVPDVDIVLTYYKELIPDYKTYIYPTGRIEGSYINDPIDYDIGEYSLRDKVITDKNGNVHTGYELIEYHGADLTPIYNIPEVIYPITKEIKVSFQKATCWESGGYNNCTYNISIKNNSDNEVSSWEFDMPIPKGVSVTNVYEGSYVKGDGYITIKNLGYNGTIGINEELTTVSILLRYNDPYYEPEVTAVRIDMWNNPGLRIVSVGDYAYYHSNSMAGFDFSVNNNSIIEIGEGAFESVSGLNEFKSNSVEHIKENAFYSSGLKKATFTNLNKADTESFGNMPNLYYLDLGTVKHMDSKTVANCNYLYQLLFTGTDLNFNFSSDALDNIGSLTNNRMRIYVTDGVADSSISYAEAYSEVLSKEYKDNFYLKGDIVGSYVPKEINADVGAYNVRIVTIKNMSNVDVTGFEIIDYHGETITSNFEFPNTLTIGNLTYPVISIGKKAFINDIAQKKAELTLGNAVLKVSDYAFYKSSIGRLIAPNVIDVKPYAFAECNNLLSVDLPASYMIGEYAFYSNPSLKDVVLSSSTKEIGNYAFYNTVNRNNLNNLYISASVPPVIYDKSLPEYTANIDNNKPIIYVPYSAVSTYQEKEHWKNYKIQNIGNIYGQTYVYEKINDEEIRLTGYLKEEEILSIPDTLDIDGKTYKIVEIEGDILNSNDSVKTLILPLYLKSIGDNLLSKNISVNNIEINENNEYFTAVDGVLYDKNKTTLIKYPNGKMDSTFIVPNGVILIKSNAFNNSINLTSITLNSDLFIISNDSFKDCLNLITIKFTGIEPPYITAFDVLPINKNMVIKIPKGSLDAYKNNPYYYKYISYMVEE